MMLNTILVAYRQRPACLRTFLESIELADDTELVIVDLGSQDNSAGIIAQHKDRLPTMRHLWVDYTGMFWKTKALNYGLKHTDSEWVTMFDADCLFPKGFCLRLSDYLKGNADQAGATICNRTLPQVAYKIYRYPESFFRGWLIPDPAPDWLAQFDTKLVKLKSRYPNPAYMEYRGHYTGNSHFTMHRADLVEMGGWDERFIGYGAEDHELNMRKWVHFGDTIVFPEALFQTAHRYEGDWVDTESGKRNQALLNEAEARLFPPLERNTQWGEFQKESDTQSAKAITP